MQQDIDNTIERRYSGIASVGSFVINDSDAATGSIFQIGWAFAIGIAFAIIICAPTSGGHFNPAITISFALWKGFPWRKVPQYIFAQIFGSFVAGLVVVGQYWEQISMLKGKLLARGATTLNFNGGPGSILCSFPSPDQNNLGYLFMTEFMASGCIAVVIWASLDPANPFVSPLSAPFIIGIAFAVMMYVLVVPREKLNEYGC